MRGVRGLSGAVEGDEFGRRRVLTTSLDGRCRESPGHCVAAPLARPLPYSGGGLFKGSLRDSRRLDRSRRHFRIASVGDAFDESSSSEGGRVTVGAARRELRVDSLWREFSDDFVTSAQLGVTQASHSEAMNLNTTRMARLETEQDAEEVRQRRTRETLTI